MSQDKASLDQLRREIDRIDDGLHDLLMQRASLVAHIAEGKPTGRITLRPGREAQVLRRLIARHSGDFPKAAVVRIWREIMGGLVALQGPFSVAVFVGERNASGIELARNHFGATVPLVVCRSIGQMVKTVANGQAAVGVTPLAPANGAGDEAEPWWTSLAAGSDETPRVVARLPFAATEPVKGAPEPAEGLVIACRDHDESGDDRTLAVLETLPDVSRDRLRAVLTAGKLEPTGLLATHRRGEARLHLVELVGHVTAGDPRLAAVLAPKDPISHASVIGGYAAPFTLDALA
jgi:chorismate mutase